MDILEDILANKREEIARNKASGHYDRILSEATAGLRNISMSRSLGSSDTGIISEFKRKSPSKGWINQYAEPADVTTAYQRAGASAISVLTDSVFFGGSIDDLIAVRQSVDLPILRKDFIIDEVQIAEAAAIGADAVLLIAAALTVDQCRSLADCAHRHGLETLLEIHGSEEIRYVDVNIDMVGVNNRNLGTFHTDVANSFALAALLPAGKVLVSESGISQPQTVAQLRGAGYRGFLIGETLMRTPEPGDTLADFIEALKRC